MRHKPILLIFLVAALLLASGASLWWGPPWWRDRQLIRQSEPIQAALESYRQRHGHFPESLFEAAIPEPEAVYYHRAADGSYMLWFGTTLGESVTYRSSEHRWQ